MIANRLKNKSYSVSGERRRVRHPVAMAAYAPIDM
jgi:hypothetical protein